MPVGRVLSRREVVALLGFSGVALLAGRAWGQPAPACVVRPAQTEGPYFVDERLNRSDIRSDPATGAVKAGTPLELAFQRVAARRVAAARRSRGAQVDVWHCDALGVYSDVRDPRGNTVGQKFLRGYQVTDDAGAARSSRRSIPAGTRAAPCTSTSRSAPTDGGAARVHVAALLRRRAHRPVARAGAVHRPRPAPAAERRRRAVPQRRQAAAPPRHRARRGLRGHVRARPHFSA